MNRRRVALFGSMNAMNKEIVGGNINEVPMRLLIENKGQMVL
jgi:hypothetical protein